jgi:methyl-accepting chemotaxis protein
VADEIQRLAEQSNEQAKEISGDLVRVANAIDSVKGASDSAVAAFGAIFERSDELAGAVRAIGEAMTEQMEGGRQVLGSLGRLKDITREIEVGSVEMASGNAAMLGHVSRLRTATASVLQGNEETLRGTKEINDAIVETTELTSRNASHIAEVREAADRFVL